MAAFNLFRGEIAQKRTLPGCLLFFLWKIFSIYPWNDQQLVFLYQIYFVFVYTRYLVFVRGKKTNTCQRALLCQQPSWQSQHRHNCHNHHNHSWHKFGPSLKFFTVIMLFNIIAVIIIIIEMDKTLVSKAHWAEDIRNLHNWYHDISIKKPLS